MKNVLEAVRDVLRAPLFDLAGTQIDLFTVLVFVAILVATLRLARGAEHAVERFMRRRGIQDQGSLAVSRRLTHYLTVALGASIAVHTLGINLTALFTAGAVFAIGLGFAMQTIAQNFVAGVILLVERAIKPGDVLQVEGTVVRVVRMGIRSMVARTLDEEDLIIPNATLIQSTVKNYTLRDSDFRIRARVGVSYGSDLHVVFDTLKAAATRVSARHLGREPRVLLVDFGSSSVDFDVSVWIGDPWRMQAATSELRQEIWWALKDAGITIAFPQMDVHFDREFQEAVAGARS